MRRQLTAGCAVLALLAGCTRHEVAKAPSGPGEGAGVAGEATPDAAAGKLINRIDELIDRLSHDDPAVRGEAAEALAKIGPPAAPGLLALLRDQEANAALRRKAACLLGGLGGPGGVTRAEGGPPAAGTVPALRAAMRDRDALVRDAAARSLARTGPAGVTALARALSEPRREVKTAAAEALGLGGETALAVVPDMVRAARDFNLRPRIARSIRRIGPEAVAAAVRLLGEQPSIYTVYLLEEIRPGAETAVPILVGLLGDSRARVRDGVVSILGKAGPAAASAAPALASLMREAEPGGQLRVKVARALVRIDPENEEAIAILLDQVAGLQRAGIQKRTVGVRDLADDVASLAELGPAARGAVPALVTLLRSPSANTRIVAADAILKIDPGSTAPLDTLMRELGGKLGLQAARLLGKMGPAAKGAVPKLIRMLESKGPAFVRPVAEALGGIGPDAVPALTKALGHEHPNVRVGAVTALGKIGPGAKSALGALQGLTRGRGGDAKLAPLARSAIMKIARAVPAAAGAAGPDKDVPGLWERSRGGADRKVFIEGLRRAMVCPLEHAAERARDLEALAAKIPDGNSRRLVELALVNVLVTRTPPSKMNERLYREIRRKLDALGCNRPPPPARHVPDQDLAPPSATPSQSIEGRAGSPRSGRTVMNGQVGRLRRSRTVLIDANMVHTELVVLDHRLASDGDREYLHGRSKKLLGSLRVASGSADKATRRGDETVTFRDDLWPGLRRLILGRASLIVLRHVEARLTAELGLSPEERRLPAAREYVAVLEEVGAPREIVMREKLKLSRAAARETRNGTIRSSEPDLRGRGP